MTQRGEDHCTIAGLTQDSGDSTQLRPRPHTRLAGRHSVDLAMSDPPSGTVTGEVGLRRLDPLRRAALVSWWIAEDWRVGLEPAELSGWWWRTQRRQRGPWRR